MVRITTILPSISIISTKIVSFLEKFKRFNDLYTNFLYKKEMLDSLAFSIYFNNTTSTVPRATCRARSSGLLVKRRVASQTNMLGLEQCWQFIEPLDWLLTVVRYK